MALELTEEQIKELKGAAAAERWQERAEYFEKTLHMSTTALARIGRELGQVKHELKQSEVLAGRYPELLRTIVALADLCEDVPRDLALAVQEARAITDGCKELTERVE